MVKMATKAKRIRWSVSTSQHRKVEIKDGRFGTVTTKQNTRFMDFGYVYYISSPIPEDEFVEKVCLWRPTRSHIDHDPSLYDANYRGADTDLYGELDVWIPRTDSCTRPKVRPLPALPSIPVAAEAPEGWYDMPEESESGNSGDGLSTSNQDDLSSNDTFWTNFATRGSSLSVMYVQDETPYTHEYYAHTPEEGGRDSEQTRRKLEYCEGSRTITRTKIRYSVLPHRQNDVDRNKHTNDAETHYMTHTKETTATTQHTVSITSSSPVVTIIKKLDMPTISWAEAPAYIHDDSDTSSEDSDYDDTGLAMAPPPPVPPRVSKAVSADVYGYEPYEEQKPDIPPRKPIKAATEEDYEEWKEQKSLIQHENHSSITCSICEQSDISQSPISTDHDELHRLQAKQLEVKNRNTFDRAKIETRQKINTELKEELNNKIQLNKLEREELEYESAISNIGKQTQMDEYYGKCLPLPPVSRKVTNLPSPKETSDDMMTKEFLKKLDSLRINKSFRGSWLHRSTVSRGGRKSFSSKIYAADSGIGGE